MVGIACEQPAKPSEMKQEQSSKKQKIERWLNFFTLH